MKLSRAPFGRTRRGEDVEVFTLAAGALRARVLTYGAVIASLEAPDRDGRLADVVLGYATLAEYEADGGHVGAVAGRFANRIANARFDLDGVTHRLTANEGSHHLHGGARGFGRVVWRGEPLEEADAVGVRLRRRSPDGEEGYPGSLDCEIAYRLTRDGALRVAFRASTTRATPVGLTQHSYFQLAGEGAGDVLGHELRIDAARYLPVDAASIPTGELRSVAGTPFDFRTPRAIGRDLGADDEQVRIGRGYDHCFALDSVRGAPAARVVEPRSGRVLEVLTDQPGLQLYTGNHLDGRPGKSGRPYAPRQGLCLEAQAFPDAPNQPGFPNAVLRPGERYAHDTEYRFSAE